MSKFGNKKYHKKCQELGERIQKELNGEDLSIGMNVMVMTMAAIIVESFKKGTHLQAFTTVTKHLMTILIEESPTMRDELEDAALPMEAMKELVVELQGKHTKH